MLETIRTRRGACDEVLIVKDGCLTDTSYTNIALWDGHRWVLPRHAAAARAHAARRLIDTRDG
jgi:4-amino-4-deoxychorismate lyase